MINEEVRQIVEPELTKGEELLWADKPEKGFEAKKAMILIFKALARLFIISLAVISFLAFIYSILSKLDLIDLKSKEATDVMIYTTPILTILFIFGFIFISRRCDFAFELTEAIEYEVYAITQNRGLIISPYFKQRVRVISRPDLKKHLVNGEDIGGIRFPAKRQTPKDVSADLKYGLLFKFHNIKNPNFVSKLIHQKF